MVRLVDEYPVRNDGQRNEEEDALGVETCPEGIRDHICRRKKEEGSNPLRRGHDEKIRPGDRARESLRFDCGQITAERGSPSLLPRDELPDGQGARREIRAHHHRAVDEEEDDIHRDDRHPRFPCQGRAPSAGLPRRVGKPGKAGVLDCMHERVDVPHPRRAEDPERVPEQRPVKRVCQIHRIDGQVPLDPWVGVRPGR